ncbi:vesicle-associated membrane protein 5-like [Scleropages formosus]|uniref:Vesicle-associated membrane protein 5 n=1 Tax=Scleropages formosus TaxID=113540 RepID=A0A0P7U003_SCLFO|nr:vesicle-associated membrane protein 5-like [Scleropages formosus]KPP59786.1 vesicle-associated membrane protein 5-like [Scleropages formosus]
MENGKSRLKQAQEEVEEVKEIMLDNLNKAEERTGKLGELEDRAEHLLEMSKGFEKTTHKLKQQKRCEAMKMKILLGGIGVFVLLVIIIVVISVMVPSSGQQNSNQVTAPNPTLSVKT